MTAPTPLTPPDADLQDFPFMPLHVARLRDSDLAAEEHPEACWYAVLLWAASWHQIPAGSLPDNDTVLMRLVGLGRDSARRWRRHRKGALRGFVRCNDGRLYHPIVAEIVSQAWAVKQRLRARLDKRLRIETAEWHAIRKTVFARDDFTCRYCGVRGARMECDHVIPYSAGGQTTLDNLVTACRSCNRSKGAKSLEEWAA
ncbi:HNH endonuclease [Rhizorhabdus histidinilytica]|uniref:HNH endonuclease n=1 Tax=Rhizorhabdus histidinilytica TaxID=439228 RepID=UPI00322059A0